MEFRIIDQEQTPKIPEVTSLEALLQKEEVLNAFLEFAKKQPTAIGLAANQVSINGERFMERVIAVKDLKDGEWKLAINPIIEEYVGMKEMKQEGCLTWGREKVVVAERSRAVKVAYYTMDGKKVEGEFHKGLASQLWQHEINHINGVEERIENVATFDFSKVKTKEPGRNDECPCGSGKKYKKCCINLVD